MDDQDHSLARQTIKIWMISLPVCVFGGILGAIFLKSAGVPPKLNIAITICIVFLPVAIVSLNGLIRGYIPRHDLRGVYRGGYSMLINAAGLALYITIALVALFRA